MALLALPVDVLVGQLRGLSAVDLASLAVSAPAARAPTAEDGLPLHAFVARSALLASLALEFDEDLCRAAGGSAPGAWLRLFHFLRCAPVGSADAPAAAWQRPQAAAVHGHLCCGRPGYVRCGATRLELLGEELSLVHASLVHPLGAWLGAPPPSHGGAPAGTRGSFEALPLPDSCTVRANTTVESIAMVTRCGQLHAVVPLHWGEGTVEPEQLVPDQNRLAIVARMLNQRGECAAVRTHRLKVHLLSLAQVRVATRSQFQPLLSDALRGFAGVEPPLWAIVYTEADPGFFSY